MPPSRRPSPARVFAGAALLVGVVATAARADVVVLTDGFVIQGTVRKEMDTVRDPALGQPVPILKAAGFDYVDDGARLVVFSSHHKQLGEIAKGVKVRPDYKAYTTKIGNRQNAPLPAMLGTKGLPDFDEKWKRSFKVDVAEVANGWTEIKQQVTYLDPYCCFVVSTNYRWSQSFRTSEMDPRKVRKMLGTHPELVEAPGTPEPLKRIAIARFMKDAGWIFMAKEEIARLKRDVPGALPKEAQEALDKLLKDIDVAVAELVVTEAETVLAGGRYGYAGELLAAFPDKTADPKEIDRATRLMAQLKTAREQYEAGRRLLRALIDDVTGGGEARPFLAVIGGPVGALWPNKAADTRLAALAAAAEVVYAELHPDSAGRIEFFVNLAAQVEREKKDGKPATKKPEELLATAISGWVKGKNGANPAPDLALRVWAARLAVLDFQRAVGQNQRNNVLVDFRKGGAVGIDELAQIISLLPPAEPDNLAARGGTPVRPGNGVPEGVYKRRSAPYGTHLAGVDYYVKLPPEYHHGRAYPVLLCLTYPGVDAERFLGAVANDADKNGYILVAPDWCPAFGTKVGWDWTGGDHDYVTGALRDVVRHFTVDNDRVFLLGGGAGADGAMDVGMSHPDLFAGVVSVGPSLRPGFFMDYWRNAQKLPVYVVTGELSGEANKALQPVFQHWMPKGFPGLHVMYRGRGVEWYPAEVPVVFDWMGRKKRATWKAVLALGGTARFEWQTMREADNHFFWLGADKIDPGHLLANTPAGRLVVPATLMGDIGANNTIRLRAKGVRTVTVSLTRDMIDWTRKVQVSLNDAAPIGWKARTLEQDMHTLLDDYWERGDRRMLFVARLEFINPN